MGCEKDPSLANWRNTTNDSLKKDQNCNKKEVKDFSPELFDNENLGEEFINQEINSL